MHRYTAVNPSILIGDRPLPAQLDAVGAAGFTEVELWWPFAVAEPSLADVDRFLGLLDGSGLRLIGLNSYEGGMAEGNRGIACWPDVDRDFDAAIRVADRIVRETGCPGINVLHGVRSTDEPADVQDERAAVRTARAADALADAGAIVTLEQLSHIPGYGLRTVADVLAAVERSRGLATVGRVMVQVDLFHMFRVGDDVEAFFADHWRDIGHVQVADEPGRGAPGTGSRPIDALLDLLLAQGYERSIALEYSAWTGDDPFAIPG